MSRRKSEATMFLEDLFSKNPNATFSDVTVMPEYKDNFKFDNAYFNAIKHRFKRSSMNVSPSLLNATNSAALSLLSSDENQSAVNEYDYGQDVIDMIPSVDQHFFLSGDALSFFELVNKMSHLKNANIRLVGPAGCGKTSFATQYAARYNLPCHLVNCANVREPRDWFGYRKLDNDKNLVWHESLFVKMIETPYSVIILDETNRCPMHTLNTLYPLLDHRRHTYLEEAGRVLQVAEGVTFWAAMNEGNQFTGTSQLDEAFADRTGLVHECKFLPMKEEAEVLHNRTGLAADTCTRLVEVAEQVRKKFNSDGAESFTKPISTRMLEEAAAAFVLGGSKTLHFTLLNHFSTSGGNVSERSNLFKLLVGKFGTI